MSCGKQTVWREPINRIKLDFEKMVPLGMEYKGLVRFFIGGFLMVSIGSVFLFLNRFMECKNSLYYYRATKRILIDGAIMPDFKEILGGCLLGFGVIILCMAAVAVYHYLYHFQGSKSIYLMKRLPQRWELLKRCLMLPVISILICLTTALLLLLVFYWYYMGNTPPECLEPGQWQKLWSW